MEQPPPALVRLIAAESAAPVPAAIVAVADAARRRHGSGIAAVLFYGSCLREADDVGGIADLYLLADSYGQVHRRLSMRALNRLLPPNVYYIEATFEGRTCTLSASRRASSATSLTTPWMSRTTSCMFSAYRRSWLPG